MASEMDLSSMSLEDLLQVEIKSTAFYKQTALNSTGSAWIFSQQEIAHSPIVFLKDIFEYYAPGTSAGYSTFSGSPIGVRGIAVSDNDKTLFLVNGQNLNQISLYGYQAGMQSTLLGDIDHIEVVNGPGAILHGSGAINNIINVTPKNGHDYQGIDVTLEYGANEQLKKLELGYGHSYNPHSDLYVYVGAAQANGFLPDSYLEHGTRPPEGDDPNRKVYHLPENYRASAYLNHKGWEFQTQFQRVKRSFNKNSNLSNAAIWRGHWQTYWASRVKYTHQLNSNQKLELSIPLEFYDHGVQLNPIEKEKGGRESHTGLKGTFFQQWRAHKLAVGAALTYRTFDAQKQYFEADKQFLEESLDGELHKYELFAENIWAITEDWTASLGLRYDDIRYGTLYEPEAEVEIKPDMLAALTKRVASSYQISDHRTIKFAYQEGFRYPDVSYYLTYGVANAALSEANLELLPTLQEETVYSYEINYLQSNQNYTASWEFNLYHNTYKNTLSWVDYTEAMLGPQRYNTARQAIGFGPGAYANTAGKLKAIGGEIVGNWQPSPNFTLRSSYSFSRPTNSPNDPQAGTNMVNHEGRWANYPEHIIKLAINHQITRKFHVNITTYYSPSVDICTEECTNELQTPSQLFHKQDRLRVNSRIQYQLNKRAKIAFTVQNIFQDKGPPVGYDTRDGTGSEGGLGDDSRRAYLSLNIAI